jgi:DHA1 family tetracycline resistance protein-like MFS transporter
MDETSAGGHKRSSLAIIFVTVFIDLLGFAIVLPLLPRYAEHFQASAGTLGMLMASFSAMQFIFSPIWGRVSDRVGRRPILIMGLAGSMVSYALFGLASSFEPSGRLLGLAPLTWLFITRIGAGIFGATISTAQAYIADVTSPAQRARGMALIGAAFGVGFTFGPLLGALFVSGDAEGAPSPYPGYVASGLSGLALLSAIFMLPESLSPNSSPSAFGWFLLGNLATAMARAAIAPILIAMFFTTFAFAEFEATLALLTQNLGVSDKNNYLVFAYVGFVLALSQGLIVRRLVPRVGEFRMSLAGTVLMAAGLIGVAVASHLQSLAVLCIMIAVCVMGFSALTPSLQSLLSRNAQASEQGAILGIGQGVAAVARILGPFVGIVLFKSTGVSHPYWMGALIMALSVFLIMPLRKSPVLE